MQADEVRRILGLESQSLLGQALPSAANIPGLQAGLQTNNAM